MTTRAQRNPPVSAKVWIVAPSPPPYGGMSVQAEKLCARLRNDGLDAKIIPTNPQLPRLLDSLQRVPGVRTLLREIQFLLSLRKLFVEPGIVHHLSASNLYFFLHSAPLLLLPVNRSRKLILNYRGGAAADFLQRWAWLVVPLMRRTEQILVPSPFLRQVFWDYGLKASLLSNIADTESFPFIPREPLRPRFFVSRNLEPMYDVACILHAYALIQQQIPDARLGIAGSGSEEMRLRRLAEQLGLRGVEFYGAVPSTRLPSLYAKFDIYLNASRVDNFPGALVEAACSGLPIVTTNAGGIPSMLQHRETGLLEQVGDAQALAGSALELLGDPELASHLSRNARTWAEQFSWARVSPELFRCYGLNARDRQESTPEHAVARQA